MTLDPPRGRGDGGADAPPDGDADRGHVADQAGETGDGAAVGSPYAPDLPALRSLEALAKALLRTRRTLDAHADNAGWGGDEDGVV